MITTMLIYFVLIPLVLLGVVWVILWVLIREYNTILDVVGDIRKRGKRTYHIDRDRAIEVKDEDDKKENLVTKLERLNEVERRDMAELIKMMREEREMERLRENDKSLAERAEALRNKNRKPQPVMSSLIGRGEDRPVRTNAKILIPANLSEMDKEILEEFYNK